MTVVRMFRQRLLDILIILAVAFHLPIFWLIEKILRSRHKLEKVGSTRGGADAEGAMVSDEPLSGPKNGESPPSEAPPPIGSQGFACYPLQALFGEIIRQPLEREVENIAGTNYDFTHCGGCSRRKEDE